MTIPANWPQDLTDLANRVMQKLGEVQRFDDIATDTGDNADTIRDALYDIIRDAQHSFKWTELETLETLETPDETFEASEAYGFAYRYALPDDYLRPMNDDIYNYRVEGAYVYANYSENLPFKYIRYDEDVAKWGPAMFKVVLYRLASEVCLPITQSDPLLKIMEARRVEAEAEAKRLTSYNKRNPNKRTRGSGDLARLRRGIASGRISRLFW